MGKVQLKSETLNLYKDRIEKRHWLSWEEYIKLSVGDKLEMPLYYQNTDQLIGKKIITIKKLNRSISTDYWDVGLEHGCLYGYCKDYDLNNKNIGCGSIGGTFAVNLDNTKEEITLENVRQKLIDAALKYVSSNTNIDLNDFKEYLNSI